MWKFNSNARKGLVQQKAVSIYVYGSHERRGTTVHIFFESNTIVGQFPTVVVGNGLLTCKDLKAVFKVYKPG